MLPCTYFLLWIGKYIHIYLNAVEMWCLYLCQICVKWDAITLFWFELNSSVAVKCRVQVYCILNSLVAGMCYFVNRQFIMAFEEMCLTLQIWTLNIETCQCCLQYFRERYFSSSYFIFNSFWSQIKPITLSWTSDLVVCDDYFLENKEC